MDRNGYYLECLADAASERGLDLAQADLKYMADAVAGAAENYGMAFPSPDRSTVSEADKLRAELRRERDKRPCEACGGRGSITIPGPYHSSTSRCGICHGEGKV